MMAEEDFDVDQNNSPHHQQQHHQQQQQQQFPQRHAKQNQTMFPPGNLSSKPGVTSEASQIKQQLNSAEEQQQSGANPLTGDYYQNVKTKSKLILPTALWILIIVGGLCFLSLLSSLNKTLGTLDTLIEIEQSEHQNGLHNQQRKQEPEHQLYHKHLKEIPTSKLHDRDSPVAEKLQTSDSEGSHSWLSFPSWTSLEPAAASAAATINKKPKHSNEILESTIGEDNMAKSILDDVIKSINDGHHDGLIPVGGSIIVASSSSSDTDDNPLYDRGVFPKSFVGSIFDQMFGGPQGDLSMPPLPPPPPSPAKAFINEPQFGRLSSSSGRPLEPMFRPTMNNEANNNESPLINAKIDKINININTHSDHDQDNRRIPDFGQEELLSSPLPVANFKRTPMSMLNEDGDMLEKSIDTLMSKLVEPEKQQHQPFGPGTQSFLIPIGRLDKPIRVDQPVVEEPMKQVHFHHNEDNSIHRMPLSPMSPLSKLLFPSSFLNDIEAPPSMSPEGASVKPTMFIRPPERHEHFIIRLESNNNNSNDAGNLREEPAPNAPLKPITPHHHSGPQPSSPYELLIPDGPPKMMSKLPTEDDLAESIAQSLFKTIESANPDFPKPESPIVPISHSIRPSPHPLHHPMSELPHPSPASAPAPAPALVPAPPSAPTPAPVPEPGQDSISLFAPSPMTMPPKPLQLPLGDSIVFINGEPLISDKKQSLSIDEDAQVPLIKAKDRNQVNDLFNLFFGPPPDSKLVVAQPQIIEPIKPVRKEPQPVKDEFSSSPLNQPIRVSKENSEKLIDADERKKEEVEPFDNELSDIFSQMLSLPQFSGQPGPQNVNQVITGRAAANASKETMQCECHKIPTNSSASSSSNSSSPRPPTAGSSSNSTSSAGSSSPNRSAGSSPDGSGSPGGPSSGPSGGSSSGSSGGSSGRPLGGSSRGSSSSNGWNSSGGSSSGEGSASSSPPGSSSPQSGSGSGSSGSSSPSGPSRGSSGGATGGSSGGSSSGPPSGGQQPRTPGQGLGAINPIGYVAAPPAGPTPVGYVALVNEAPRNQLPFYTAGQQSGNPSPRQVGPGFARPGSMLSALNNSTEFDDSEEFDPADIQPTTDEADDDSDDDE